jgi:hypothetical protein
MKKLFIIIFAAFFVAAPLLTFGQEEATKPEEKSEQSKDGKHCSKCEKCCASYSFISEYGIFFGQGVGFTGVLVNGVSLKKKDLIGIGLGYEIDTWSEQSFPIFVNYRHYFPSKSILKMFINVGVGTRLTVWEQWIDTYHGALSSWGYSKKKLDPGFNGTLAAGFRIKNASISTGFFVKSWGRDFFGGAEIKGGFTF